MVGEDVKSDQLHPAQHVQNSGRPQVSLPPVQIYGIDCVDHEPLIRVSVVVGADEVKGGYVAESILSGTISRMVCTRGRGGG